MSQARLTGVVDDYLVAKQAIDEAFEAAPKSSGPFMTRAAYHFTVHLNDSVEPDVMSAEKKLLQQDTDRAAANAMLGDPDAAIEIYESVVAGVLKGEIMEAMADAQEATGNAMAKKRPLST